MIAVLRATLASLDESLTLLSENSAKLRAAKSVDINQLIEQLNKAAESARVVRELVLSELPDTSWQSREELDGSVEKIHNILETRAAVEASRSRVLALAAALERGTIVHRRAQRLVELNHLREQAINELRSQAGADTAPADLPGPQADEWVAWACTLKEPEDAESLQAIRVGYPHLDDLIANLEPNMWTPGPPSSQIPPQSEKSAGGVQQESGVHTNEQRVSDSGGSGTSSFDSLSPRFSPQPPSDRYFTEEELERTRVREVEALARIMGVPAETVNLLGRSSGASPALVGREAIADSAPPSTSRRVSNAHSPMLAALLTPPAQMPRPITKEESPPPNPAEMQRSPNAGSSPKLPSSVTSLLTNSPASTPKIAPAMETDASAPEPAVLLRQVAPRYPMQARMSKLMGTGVTALAGLLRLRK